MSANSISQKIHRLCKEKNISIRKLSEACGYHANSLQNAMQRGKLSQWMAADIIKQYPDISLDWLLGDAEYMNEADFKRAQADENSKEAERIGHGIKIILELAKLRGFELKPYQTPAGETRYQISREEWNTKISATCSADEYSYLIGDIWGYLEFRLNRFIAVHGDLNTEGRNG